LSTSVIKIKVKAGREAEFESIITALVAASNANEPGIRFYQGFRTGTAGEYFMLESFADLAASKAHTASEHFLAHRTKLADCFDGPPEIQRLTDL
jgi:quinol monooxygenase YgiN